MAATVIGLITLAGGCGSSQTEGPGAAVGPAEVEVMTAQPVVRPVIQTYPARLAAFRKAEIRARAAGILLERKYVEGSEVKAGQLLFTIDDEQLKINVLSMQSALARAEAEHQGAQDTLRRHSTLLGKQSINEHDHVASLTAEKRTRAEVGSAEAALADAELKLSYAQVTAPISGRAGMALVSEGTLVGQDGLTPLTVIEQIDPIYVNFAQPVPDLAEIKSGARQGLLNEYADADIVVQLIMPDGSIYGHEGRLVFSDVAVDPNTDNIAMKAQFPNPNSVLMPGAYIRVNLIRAVNPQIFLVPRDTVVLEENSSHIFVATPEGVVEKRAVTVRNLEGPNWQVTGGLKTGEKIILNSVQATPMVGEPVAAVSKAGQKEMTAATPAVN